MDSFTLGPLRSVSGKELVLTHILVGTCEADLKASQTSVNHHLCGSPELKCPAVVVDFLFQKHVKACFLNVLLGPAAATPLGSSLKMGALELDPGLLDQSPSFSRVVC